MSLETSQSYRLSPRQRQIWPRLRAGDALRAQSAIRIDGDLRPEALERALVRAAERHEALRTVFHHTPGLPLPVQIVGGSLPLSLRHLDAGGLAPVEEQSRLGELLDEEWRRPFDLERGPLLHALLVRCAADRHLLVLTLPALCADRRTLENLLAEIAMCYDAAAGAGAESDPEEIVQYLQCSEWHNEILEDEESGEGKAYWHRQGSGERPALPELPAVVPGAPFAPRLTPVDVSPGVPAALAALAAEQGTSTESILLAAWAVLLWRLTAGGSRIAVGRMVVGRKYEPMEGTLGLFAGWVPVEVGIAPGLPFAEVVRRVERISCEAEDWQEYFVPGEQDAAAALCGFELGPPPAAARTNGAARVAFSPWRTRAYVEPFLATLVCQPAESGLTLELHVDAGRLSERFAELLAGRVARLLESALAAPSTRVEDLAVLSVAEERWLLVELNCTGVALSRDLCLHHLFAAQVERTPEAVAVRSGSNRLTYRELDDRADRLARRLSALGVGPEVAVAIFTRRSPAALVAILGTWKAGAAYVPLEPAYPGERLAFQLADSRARVVLTESALADRLPAAAGLPVVLLDADLPESEPPASGDGAAAVSPQSLAYILYTSGSTGRPKGVMVAHEGLVNYLSWAVRAYDLAQGEGSLVQSPLGFDLTVTGLLGPLLTGRTVTLLPDEAGLDELRAALDERDYGLVKLTPAHLDLLGRELAVREVTPRVRALVVGGEVLSAESLANWRRQAPATRVFNEYGPTETVVGCAAYEIGAESPARGPLPIGRAIANVRLYVLDPWLRPVPTGVPGELYVGGVGVSRGYLGRPDLTASLFLPDPFAGVAARMYRTGDLVRCLLGGDLEFLGRADRQIKVRGFRVEPGEIEAVLVRDPRVREAAVVLREDNPGDPRLVAYLVPSGDTLPGFEELRAQVGAHLPEHMMPATFVSLAALPLTANGKLDRAALPTPGTERPDLERSYVAPRDVVEEVLAGVWAASLGLDRIGVFDNFFVLGGDSMRSVRVVAWAKERGLVFTVQELFRFPTVAALAEMLRERIGLVPSAESQAGAGSPLDDGEDLAAIEQLERLSDEEVRALLREGVLPQEMGG